MLARASNQFCLIIVAVFAKALRACGSIGRKNSNHIFELWRPNPFGVARGIFFYGRRLLGGKSAMSIISSGALRKAPFDFSSSAEKTWRNRALLLSLFGYFS
jgi:hypothetical protein